MIDSTVWDRSLRAHNARPERKITYRGHEILLADSGPHFDPEHDPDLKQEVEAWRNGYYAAVAMVPGKIATWVGIAYFQVNHDKELSDEARKNARLKAAEAQARDHVDTGFEAEMYHA